MWDTVLTWLTTNGILIAIISQWIAIIWLIRKTSKPIRMVRQPTEIEEGSTASLGKAIERWKPMIINNMVKRSDKDTEETYERRKTTVNDMLDGTIEFLKADALKDIFKFVKEMMK